MIRFAIYAAVFAFIAVASTVTDVTWAHLVYFAGCIACIEVIRSLIKEFEE